MFRNEHYETNFKSAFRLNFHHGGYFALRQNRFFYGNNAANYSVAFVLGLFERSLKSVWALCF